MSVISSILSGGAAKLIGKVKDLADEFHLSGEEKNDFTARMETLFQERDSEIEQTIRAELEAKSGIIIAEMAQGDAFTKRARPSVVYFGLAITLLNYTILPLLKITPPPLPTEFWLAWTSVVSVWCVGRSAEKRGSRNRVSDAITGNGKGLMGLIGG